MELTPFNLEQDTFLLTGALLLIGSVLLHQRHKYGAALFLLFAGALSLRFFAAYLDPFLNVWDERFHALVAKNISEQGFIPMLYAEKAIDTSYSSWINGHVWLHKQPLFLWQIALSFKAFGVNEFTLRLPSAIMSSLLTLLVYRLGHLLVNRRVGLYSGLLTATSYFLTELVSGKQGMEHNDISFLFYITASFWAWLEYEYSGRQMKWIMLIGLFSGCAILCKWLVGLLVYAGWGLSVIIHQRGKELVGGLKDLAMSVVLIILIVAPWQIFILTKFPKIAQKEFALISKHLFEVIEKHDGDIWYHLDHIDELYGAIIPYLILPSFIFLFFKIKSKHLRIPVLAIPIIVYAFFSIAATKLRNFPIVVQPIFFIALATFGNEIIARIEQTKLPKSAIKIAELLILVYIGSYNLNLNTLTTQHVFQPNDKHQVHPLANNKSVFLNLKETLPTNSVVFFEFPGFHYVEAMFYSNLIVYGHYPTEAQIAELKKEGRPIVVLKTKKLPEHIKKLDALLVETTLKGGW